LDPVIDTDTARGIDTCIASRIIAAHTSKGKLMRTHAHVFLGLVLGLVGVVVAPAKAQQHRATHLGNPVTRFAPPLVTQEDLRARFSDPKLKPDIVSILQQWGWKGSVEDLFRAATNAEITEMKLPIGTRMPFMSSREHGKQWHSLTCSGMATSQLAPTLSTSLPTADATAA
jgi:hypothetical protein